MQSFGYISLRLASRQNYFFNYNTMEKGTFQRIPSQTLFLAKKHDLDNIIGLYYMALSNVSSCIPETLYISRVQRSSGPIARG